MSSTITTSYSSGSSSVNSPSPGPRGSSPFKGVIYQRNGHVGAQIYVNQQRIWLGTFKTEIEAAIAYDSASIKLQQGCSGPLIVRNFPWSVLTIHEPNFQAQFTNDQVLDMIKDGSYQLMFAEFLCSAASQVSLNPQLWSHNGEQEEYFSQELFRKELTISDVGKLNRFVIPKRYALKYFPKITDLVEGEKGGGGQNGCMELVFYDNMMNSWKFKYCYWKSSKTFVLTKGWMSFVRANSLEAKDVVAFYVSELKKKDDEGVMRFWMVQIIKSNAIVKAKPKSDGGLKLFGVQIVPPKY